MADVEVVGTPEIVKVIARGPAGPVGSGTPIVNWMRFGLSSAALLTPGLNYVFQVADFSIVKQSGDDFSIDEGTGNAEGSGVVYSAAGGQFLCAVTIRQPIAGFGSVVIDAGSAKQRFVWLGAQPGPTDPDDPDSALSDIGIDISSPVVDAYFGRVAGVGTPSYVPPGGPVYQFFNCTLLNGFGGDSVPVSSLSIECEIWQTAAAS